MIIEKKFIDNPQCAFYFCVQKSKKGTRGLLMRLEGCKKEGSITTLYLQGFQYTLVQYFQDNFSVYETVYRFDFNKHFIPLVSLLQRIAGFHAWDFKVLKLMTTSLSNALTTWACCIGFQVVVIFKRAATQTQSPYSEGGGTILWLWSFTFLLLISNETSSSFPRYLPKLRPRQVVAGCCRT